MTQFMPSLCLSCKHLRGSGTDCLAFPSGIPRGIRIYGDDHRQPTQKQSNSVVWELKDGDEAKESFTDWQKFNGGTSS